MTEPTSAAPPATDTPLDDPFDDLPLDGVPDRMSGWALVYEVVLGILAVVTVATLFFDGPWAALVNWSIYAIFLADVDAVGQSPYRWAGSTAEPYWAGI